MDHYQRLKTLGHGSYGSAVLVRESAGRKQLRVIKEIDTLRLPKTAQKEVQTEVGVLKSLSHPNIVAYCDAFFDGNKLCIVMEFADGGDLGAAVKERAGDGRQFPEREVIAIFAQCCLALQHVHSKHILHRDLKSQNIFMTASKVVKLGDFGVARVLDSTAAEAKTMIGTPIYLAPEVCNSKPYGTKADIWSLGIVIYELFALKPPFQGSNIASLCMKIMRTEPEPLSEKLYSEESRAIVAWMLQKSAERRPSVRQLLSQPLLQEVARAFGQVPASAEDGIAPSPDRPVRSRGASPSPTAPGSAAAAEFHRNRELAAQLKARAEGASRPPGLPRSRSSEQMPPDAELAPAPERGRGSQRAEAEQRHLQALQDAAAQARRDRLQVQQRMREHAEEGQGQQQGGQVAVAAVSAAAAAAPAAPKRPSSADAAAIRRSEEEQHLQALQEAAAQARRDRRQVQQRVKQLERDGDTEPLEGLGGPNPDLPRAGAKGEHPGPGRKPQEEQQHLAALQAAAAQARRDRKEVQQRVQALERAGEMDALESFVASSSSSPRSAEAAKRCSEQQHLQALQDAAVEARRERRALQQKMRDLDQAGEGVVSSREEPRPKDRGSRAAHVFGAEAGPNGSRAAAEAATDKITAEARQEDESLAAVLLSESSRGTAAVALRACSSSNRSRSRRACPGAEDLLESQAQEVDDRTRRRSALSFAGGLVMGASSSSRPTSRAPTPTPSADPGCSHSQSPAAAAAPGSTPASPETAGPGKPRTASASDSLSRSSRPHADAGPGGEKPEDSTSSREGPGLNVCCNLTKVLPQRDRPGLVCSPEQPPAPAPAEAETPLDRTNGELRLSGSLRTALRTALDGTSRTRSDSPALLDRSSGDHNTLGSSLFSYTATGTLSALSCIAAP